MKTYRGLVKQFVYQYVEVEVEDNTSMENVEQLLVENLQLHKADIEYEVDDIEEI